jgi:aminopeptidase-like protein
MIGANGGIDWGFCLPHPQMVNLDDDHCDIILKTKHQALES